MSIVLASGLAVSRVLAMPSEQVIVASCRSAQSLLSQLEKTDAVQRINRGRLYSNTLNLLFAMNARLNSNHIIAPNLTGLTSNFATGLSNFRDDYGRYDDDLNRATSIDCVATPTEFYSRLETARVSRARVANDVANLNQLMDSYQAELDAAVKGAP